MVYFFLAVLLCFHALPAEGVPAGTVRLSGQFRGFPIPLFSVNLPPVFRKFHSTIFCALRRITVVITEKTHVESTSPPSAST